MGQRRLIKQQLDALWNSDAPQEVKDDFLKQHWSKLSKKSKLEYEVKIQEAETEQALEDRPTWEVPAEVQQMIDLYKGTAEEVRGVGGEALDLARLRTERQEAPGADILTQQIMTAGATAREKAMQATGGGISGLGSISDIFRGEVQALQQQAARNLAYTEQTEKDLQLALGTYGQTLMGATQLEGAGLQEGARQEEQAFQINKLDPYYDVLNYNLAKLGVSQSELEALKQRRAQFWANLVGAGGEAAKAIPMV